MSSKEDDHKVVEDVNLNDLKILKEVDASAVEEQEGIKFKLIDDQKVIIAVTKQKLLDELIESVSGSQTSIIFPLIYSYFMTEQELVSLLMEKFETESENVTRQNITRARVCNILKYWIENNDWVIREDHSLYTYLRGKFVTLKELKLWEKWGNILLQKLDAITSEDETVASPTPPEHNNNGTTTEEELTHKKDKKTRSLTGRKGSASVKLSLKFFSKHKLTSTFLEMDTVEVAEHITSVEANLFNKLKSKEFLHKRFEKPLLSPNLNKLTEHFNYISRWIMTEILSGDTPEKRCGTIMKFIELAQELFKLNNFSGVMQIVVSLENPCVSRLKQSWKGIPSKMIEKYNEIKEAISMDNNFANYRKTLLKSALPRIPIQGCYMKDLTFIEENSTYLESGTYINWVKMGLIGKLILSIKKAQEQTYTVQANTTIANYLNNYKVINSDKELYILSKQLEGPGGSAPPSPTPIISDRSSSSSKDSSISSSSPPLSSGSSSPRLLSLSGSSASLPHSHSSPFLAFPPPTSPLSISSSSSTRPGGDLGLSPTSSPLLISASQSLPELSPLSPHASGEKTGSEKNVHFHQQPNLSNQAHKLQNEKKKSKSMTFDNFLIKKKDKNKDDKEKEKDDKEKDGD